MRLDRLFSLKEPCKDCPFLKEAPMRQVVGEERMQEIIESLHNDAPFHCHKTIDYEHWEQRDRLENALYCAGALLYMQKVGYNNLPMRLGIAFELFDPAALRGHGRVIDPKEEKR